MKNILMGFLLIMITLDAVYAVDCESVLTLSEAKLVVEQYRKERPKIPTVSGKFEISLNRNPQSCHYVYSEKPKSKISGGGLTYIIDEAHQVIDLRSVSPLKAEIYKCPRLDISKEIIASKVAALRQVGDKKYPKIQKKYNATKLSLLRCLYLFEEFDDERVSLTEGNKFYFDAAGNLVNFYSSMKN